MIFCKDIKKTSKNTQKPKKKLAETKTFHYICPLKINLLRNKAFIIHLNNIDL
jgi:hypothetical protein